MDVFPHFQLLNMRVRKRLLLLVAAIATVPVFLVLYLSLSDDGELLAVVIIHYHGYTVRSC